MFNDFSSHFSTAFLDHFLKGFGGVLDAIRSQFWCIYGRVFAAFGEAFCVHAGAVLSCFFIAFKRIFGRLLDHLFGTDLVPVCCTAKCKVLRQIDAQ